MEPESIDEGWVWLWRKSLHSRVFQSEGLWKVWTWCLMRANYDDAWVPVNTGKGTTEVFIKRGQFIFGRKTAGKALKMSPRTVHKRMLKLQTMGNLTLKSDTHYSIVTVLNYKHYQQPKKDEGTPKGTPKGHPRDTDNNVKNKRIYVEDSTELRLASFLLEEILKNKPDFKQPNLQSWAGAVDLMIRRDGRTADRIREVIRWAQDDSFWRKNILSTGSLREKFDRLEFGMQGIKNGKSTW